jgi:PQQ-dependent dehydrogenase (methanol/ethanol family)
MHSVGWGRAGERIFDDGQRAAEGNLMSDWRAAGMTLLAGAVLLAAGCSNQGEAPAEGAPVNVSGPADARLINAAVEPHSWLTHGGTYAEQRFAALDQINRANVAGLRLAWSYELDTNRGQEATPLVVDGVMYASTAWSKVVALNAATGKLLWQFDPKVPPEKAFDGCCDVVNRGVAFYDGKLYVGTLDGRLIALDAGTGRQLWSQQTTDPSQPYTITGAPRIVRGKVVIGNGGAEFGVRGYVTAYDAATGAQVWRFYTVPGDPAKGPDGAASDEVLKAKAAGTWFGEYWKAGGGGTVWDSIVYDPELNQLYIGTGNGSPWNHRIRSQGKGDNLFLSSIVALDPDSGKYLWHYQETPGESWDFTATQQMILADLEIGGAPRKVLMQAPKNGFFYVLDRRTGKLLSAKPYGPVNWATGVDLKTGRPQEVPEARYAGKAFLNVPGGIGFHNWQPMSFSPRTGLVYIPVQQMDSVYMDDPAYKFRQGTVNVGVDTVPHGLPATTEGLKAVQASMKGWLLAWDPVRQKEAWRVPHARSWNGGTLATKGDLVFQGTGDSKFEAYDAVSGKRLWSFAAPSGVVAGPVSYAVKGRQYVAVLAGFGGSAIAYPNFDGPRPQPNGRVLVFALDGRAKLPAFTPSLPPIAAPAGELPKARVAEGEIRFAQNCARCHGVATFSSGVLPDLKRSAALEDADVWQQIVIGGVLKDNGMVSFSRYLTPAEAESIRIYVQKQARIN